MGPCTPSACMGPTCSRGPFRHDEYAQKYFKIARFRPDPAILQDPISSEHADFPELPAAGEVSPLARGRPPPGAHSASAIAMEPDIQ